MAALVRWDHGERRGEERRPLWVLGKRSLIQNGLFYLYRHPTVPSGSPPTVTVVFECFLYLVFFIFVSKETKMR